MVVIDPELRKAVKFIPKNAFLHAGFKLGTFGMRSELTQLRPGHTALHGLITAEMRQERVSRDADVVVRV